MPPITPTNGESSVPPTSPINIVPPTTPTTNVELNTTTSFHFNDPIHTQEKGTGATSVGNVVGMGQTNDVVGNVLVGEEMKRKKEKKEKELGGEKKTRRKDKKKENELQRQEKELRRHKKELQNKSTLETLVKQTFDIFVAIINKQKLKGWFQGGCA